MDSAWLIHTMHCCEKAYLIKLNAYTFYAIGTYNRLFGNLLRIRRNRAITQCKYYKKKYS